MAEGKYQEWLEPDGLLRLEAWARDGLTDEQISNNIGISRSTLSEWKNRFADISDALKRGKEVVDIQVENALLKRALGYSYTEVTKERVVDRGQKKRHKDGVQLTEKDWEFAKKYFNDQCCYCGSTAPLTKDHIKPLHEGGTLSRENIVPCCKSCNSSKKDKEMLSWYQSQPFYDKQRAAKIYDYVGFVIALGDLLDEQTGQLVVTKEVTKEVAPDTTAQIYWLKNRKPSAWRDRPKNESEQEALDKLDKILEGINHAAER